MPIYEYRCDECGEQTEVLQRVDEPPLTTCEDCGGAVRKLISAPAFQFKGSGWYVTDYAGKNGKNTGSTGQDDPATKKDGKESKAESGGTASSADSGGTKKGEAVST